MSPMELYVRFMFTVAVGIVGMGMVLRVLLDSLLTDWDVARDLRRAWRFFTHSRPHVEHIRAEDILLELERGRREGLANRLGQGSLDQRREALRDMREAEGRAADASPRLSEVV